MMHFFADLLRAVVEDVEELKFEYFFLTTKKFLRGRNPFQCLKNVILNFIQANQEPLYMESWSLYKDLE